MDPLTLIVAALAAGALVGLTATAEQGVKDAYAGIKTLIQRKYAEVNLAELEKKPESANRQAVAKEELADAGAATDEELLADAKALLAALEKSEAGRKAARTIGVDLEHLRAGELNIEDVTSTGSGVRIKDAEIDGSVTIKGVKAGGGTDAPN